MQIFLLGLDNTTHTLDVDASTTLSAIKVRFLLNINKSINSNYCYEILLNIMILGSDRSRRRILDLLRIQGS